MDTTQTLRKIGIDGFYLLKKDFRIVFKRTGRALKNSRFIAIGSLVLVCLIAFFAVHPYDQRVIEHVEENRVKFWYRVANSLGWWGDFAQFNLVGFIFIWLVGGVFKKRWFQRLAVVTFYSALIAGLTVNAFRFTTGRPRPYAQVEDKFYGIPGVLRGWEYHGFPSGHTSTAMGMAAPIATAGGIYGIPVVIFSSGVAWARIYKSKHYPTDVLVGGAFGGIYGIAAGWHLRKIRLRLNRRRRR